MRIAVTGRAVPVLPSCGCVARRDHMPVHRWVAAPVGPCWDPLAAGEGGFTAGFSWVAWGGHVGSCSSCCRSPSHKVMGTAGMESGARQMQFN